MSHFSVLVTLPGSTERDKLNDEITRILDPFDEGKEVEPYRDYDNGEAKDDYRVKLIREGAEHHRNGTGILPYSPGSWGGGKSGYPPEVQREHFARDARAAEILGDDPVTWERLVAALNVRYEDEDEDKIEYDPAKGQPFTMSTYNPLSKWDWWRVGGRWAGYFLAADAADVGDLLKAEPDWDSHRDIGANACDGGRKRALDLAGLRKKKTTEALERWDTYHSIVAGLPPLITWSALRAKVDAGELTMDEARQQYHTQPRVAAVSAYAQTNRDWAWIEHENFQVDRGAYGLRAMQRAVPGYALLDGAVDGRWYAPGEMGWFGVSSDDAQSYDAYAGRVNEYVDSLPEDTWVIVLDCHI